MQRSVDNYVLELLQERSLNKEFEKKIKEYVKSLSVLLKTEPTKTLLSSIDPTRCAIDSKGDKLQYHPPSKVFMSGGFSWGSAFLSENMDVDIVVEIPKECIHSKDYLNEGVLRRRALYLQHLVTILHTATLETKPTPSTTTQGHVGLIDRMTYEYRHACHKMPLLVVYPSEQAALKHTRFVIHTCLQEGMFKLNRFHVRKNNVRVRWYNSSSGRQGGGQKEDFNYVSLDSGKKEPLSSRYNNWVLAELTTQQGHNFLVATFDALFAVKQAVVLVKIWLERRGGLNKDFASGLFIAFFAAHLVMEGTIKKHHSVLHAFKLILQKLAEGKLKTEGVTLDRKRRKDGGDDGMDHNKPTMEEFMSVSEVVLVDPSGYSNVCHSVSASLYDNLCYEADRTLKVLASCQLDRFQVTFLNNHPVVCKFDRILHINAGEHIASLCSSSSRLQEHLVDQAGDPTQAFLPTLLSILSKALEGRLLLLTIIPPPPLEVSVGDKQAEGMLQQQGISVGLIFNHLTAYNHQVLGPFAENNLEVHEFQKFWGERSEQLRFMGGGIREVVTWPSDNVAASRTVISRIVKFILQRHFSIPKECIAISDSQLDDLLKGAEKKNASDLLVYGTGEEQIEEVMKSLDKLSKALRSLAKLPLSVNSVQGVSSVFRYSEVFPAVRSSCQSDAGVFKFMLVPLHRNNCPQHFPAYQVVCLLEGSSQWTDDAEALSKLKAAFYAHIGKQLKHQHHYSVLIHPDKLLIHSSPETFVFDLRLGVGKEIQLARRVELDNGMLQMMDTPLYNELNFTFNVLPVYTSILHGIQQKNNSFSSSVRLAKRWLSSQLLCDYVPDGAIELVVAHIFTPSPPTQHIPPSSPILGFIRFLQLLSTHDWKLDPLVVNLNEEFKDEDYLQIEEHFQRHRPQLPAMFISTPLDRKSEMWTLHRPSPVMLTRLVLAAKASLNVLSHLCLNLHLCNRKDFKQLFRPPTEDYNVLLHLNLLKCSRYHHGVDFNFDSAHPPPRRVARSESLFPVVDFDPALKFLADLKNEFDGFALFFYDLYGGAYIAIAWKPSAFKPVPYKVSALKYYKVLEDTLNAEQAMMVACEDLILKRIRHLGSLIIKRTEIINSLI